MNTHAITSRVAAGIAFLDETQPGWDAKINVSHLIMSSGCNCVLGQLHVRYSRAGMDDYDRAVSLGFMRDDRDAGSTWGGLSAEWKRCIIERRKGVAA